MDGNKDIVAAELMIANNIEILAFTIVIPSHRAINVLRKRGMRKLLLG
jgi:hypothetical protein